MSLPSSNRPPSLLPLRLGFLASHGGSGMRALVEACDQGSLAAEPCLLVSNNEGCEAMAWARGRGLPTRHLSARTHPAPGALDHAIADALSGAGVSLVVLSGYMRRLGSETVSRFRGRILNIHPALLPRHGGQGMYGSRVHEAVLASGDRVSGATVHLVDEHYDQGPVVAQVAVPVLPDDRLESLEQRVRAAERQLLVDTLRRIARGEIDLAGIAPSS